MEAQNWNWCAVYYEGEDAGMRLQEMERHAKARQRNSRVANKDDSEDIKTCWCGMRTREAESSPRKSESMRII